MSTRARVAASLLAAVIAAAAGAGLASAQAAPGAAVPHPGAPAPAISRTPAAGAAPSGAAPSSGSAVSAASAISARPALRLEPGAIARHQLVAVARDIEVDGDALADVAALNGSVLVRGRVKGDVIVIGGSARLGPRASVDGDISVIGGVIQVDPGARIGGRSVAYPNASPTLTTLLEGPSLGLSDASPLVLGAKLALLAAWAALLLLLFAATGRQMLETAEDVRREPFLSFFTGLTGVAALVLTALALTIFLGGLAWAPMLALVALLLLVLKLWGMVAVFYALGDWVALRLLHRNLRPLNAATLGLLLMGAIKFLPYVGVWVWTAATLIGIGATLATKFGRREAWFDLASAP
ncbi:MAG TPA: polymer-forming cytoskeletal protein [Thermoanaerobaculia bacterium]|nr:polymer-forming cytoskeletal protein [Thermoanaerobaculia bacterium]